MFDINALHLLEFVRRDQISQNNDQNIGSARQTGSSISAFLSSLIINGIVFLVMVGLFVILRKSQQRTYSPKTYVAAVPEEKKIEDLPSGLFSWVPGLYKIPDHLALGKISLDGYFFLRFFKVGMLIMFFGCVLTFVILFPVYATGGGGQTGLDTISMSNLNKDNHRHYYWAPAILSWIFFPFVLFVIFRELMHYTAVRHAYLMSPLYANRISARTVLISSIPQEYLSVPALLRLFDNVARIWINTDTDELEDTVEERDKLANKMEAAQCKYIRLADKNRRKAIKKGTADPTDAETGSVGARWVPEKKRPTHKTKFLVGKKVDTMDWGRPELQRLNEKVKELQVRQKTDQVSQSNSAFIEFTSQQAAQIAYQCLAYNRPLHMAPRYIGISPEEVVWSNMKLYWWQRSVKVLLTTSFIVVLIIFWSLPVAICGLISNINYLANTISFLHWINDIPKPILGVITGFLPTVMLAVLMALLPIVLRLMARISGCPSLSSVELHLQQSYFAFQVIQVFLITTMTSAASSAVGDIIKNPGSVTKLLATSLPKASNFYISYMILQGLTVSAGLILQIVGLVVGKLLGWLLDSTPRKKWNRFTKFSQIGWGTTFPIFTNLLVIAICYSIIAPLVMLFGLIGFALVYFAYKYNFFFVYETNIDTKGLCYVRALYQTMVGVYLAQICLIGLMAIAAAIGPFIIMIILLITTILVHMSLTSAMQPLFLYLPRSVEDEEQQLLERDEQGTNKENNVSVGVKSKPQANFIMRWLQPGIYEDYEYARALLPQKHIEPQYSTEDRENAYVHPATAATEPIFWLPRDEAGVSKECIEANTASGIASTDEYAWIDDKSKVQWEPVVNGEPVNPPDYREELVW